MTRILLVMCCVFEVVLCYQYVGLCWGDREDVRTAEKVVYTLTALFLGVFAARQRGYFLLAYPVVLVLSGCVCAALLLHSAWKKQIGCTVVCLYFSLTALLDELCAFTLLYVMEESFTVSVFFPVSGRKLLVYVFSRGCIFLLYLAVRRRAWQIRQTILEYWMLLAGISAGVMVFLLSCDRILKEALGKAASAQNTGIIMALVMIVVLILVVGSILLKNIMVGKEWEAMQLRDEMLMERYRQIQELMKESREHMHDMKHHLHILKGYSREMDIQRIREYLSELEEPVLRLEKEIWSKSQLLDLILNQKLEEAQAQGIRMELEVDPAFCLTLKDTDTCSIFSNLLDNAIEAQEHVEEEGRWIRVELQKQGDMQFIRISNRAAKVPVIKNGEFITTKKKGSLHGLGMKSVVRIVTRYGGDIQFEADEGSFAVNIVFFDITGK